MPKKSPFQRDQLALLDAKIPEFIKAVNKFDPLWKGNSKGVSVWLQDTVEELLDVPAFATFQPGFSSREMMVVAMKRKYNNYFHYTMRVKGKRKTNLRDNIDGAVKPTAQAYKRTSLVSFSNTITARDLFISENEEEIRKCYKQISKDTGIPGGGARQAAIYMMWEEADHDEWEEKARSYVHNIEENRKEFAKLATTSFRNLLESRQLGSFALSLAYAGRGKDNTVEAGKIHTAYDALKGKLITDFKFEDDEESNGRWYTFADQTLPRNGVSVRTKFQRTEDGFPLFPQLDLENMTSHELIPVLEDYFLVIWDHSQGGSTTILWDDLEQYRHNYYDDTTYVFPIHFQRPSTLPSKDVLPLAWYLMELPPTRQFTFYSKKDVEFNVQFRKDLEQSPPVRPRSLSPVHRPRSSSPVRHQSSAKSQDNEDDNQDDDEVENRDASAVDAKGIPEDGNSVNQEDGDQEDENSVDEEGNLEDEDSMDEDSDETGGSFVIDNSDENDDELEYEDLDQDGSRDDESSDDGSLSDSLSHSNSVTSKSSSHSVQAHAPKNIPKTTPPQAKPSNSSGDNIVNALKSSASPIDDPRKNVKKLTPVPQAQQSAPSLKIKVPPPSKRKTIQSKFPADTATGAGSKKKKEIVLASNDHLPTESKKRGRSRAILKSNIATANSTAGPVSAPTAGPLLPVGVKAASSAVENDNLTTRRGGRKRTLSKMGPVLISDPTKPPSK